MSTTHPLFRQGNALITCMFTGSIRTKSISENGIGERTKESKITPNAIAKLRQRDPALGGELDEKRAQMDTVRDGKTLPQVAYGLPLQLCTKDGLF